VVLRHRENYILNYAQLPQLAYRFIINTVNSMNHIHPLCAFTAFIHFNIILTHTSIKMPTYKPECPLLSGNLFVTLAPISGKEWAP
jgi:hypothetical protein